MANLPALTAVLRFGCALVLLAACSRNPAFDLHGTPLLPERSAPAVQLTADSGAPTPLIAPEARATFVFFGYTRCRDACPLALAVLAKAYRTLPQNSGVRVELVTVDPARDDPRSLRRYVRQFDSHFTALTGSRAALASVWSAFDVVVDPKTREIGHGEAIYLVDRSRRILTIYPPDASPGDLGRDAAVVSKTLVE